MANRRKSDRRLRGTWKSDRRLTFKHYRLPEKMTPTKRRRYRALFGKLKVRWGTRFVHTEIDGMKWRAAYEIVAADTDSVVVLAHNEVLERDVLTQIYLEGDCYWFWTPWGFREFFRRVR